MNAWCLAAFRVNKTYLQIYSYFLLRLVMFRSQTLRNMFCRTVFCHPNKHILHFSSVRSILTTKLEKVPKQILNINRCTHYYNRNLNISYSSSFAETIIYQKYIRLIKNAIRESGPILEQNPKLVHHIKSAEKNNLPQDFIEFARRISCEIRAEVGLYDLLLPSGCHFLIQYEDIDNSVTKHHLMRLCEKYDGSLLQGETVWPKTFDSKGIVLIENKNSDLFSNISKEKISEMGIQSYYKETDIEGVEYWKVYCDPWLLPNVKKELSQISNDIADAYVDFLPRRKVHLPQHMKKYIFNAFIKLGEVPAIDKVYTNTNLS